MIAIFDQDGTWIHNNAEEAKATLLEVYGEKLGQRAYDCVKNAPVGKRFRENGGPLVWVVDKEKADWIRKKKQLSACCNRGESMEKVGLSEEIKNLELIIDDLAAGREECEISDPQNTLEDALVFLRDYLQELKDLDKQIAENGNTPEILKAVHDKYTELWVFQLMCTVQSLPRVIGPLMSYPKPYETW